MVILSLERLKEEAEAVRKRRVARLDSVLAEVQGQWLLCALSSCI